jgi:hypothetical protein
MYLEINNIHINILFINLRDTIHLIAIGRSLLMLALLSRHSRAQLSVCHPGPCTGFIKKL